MARRRGSANKDVATAGTAPAYKDPRVSPYELFYDLVFAAAVLGISLDYSKTAGFTSLALVTGAFVFIWWVWQETVLFTNRYGDPLRPIDWSKKRRAVVRALVIRWACLLQMIAVVGIALFDPKDLGMEGFQISFPVACAFALSMLLLMRELGAYQHPSLRSYTRRHRPWTIVAIVFFLLSEWFGLPASRVFWTAALAAVVIPGIVLIARDRILSSAGQAKHLSERLMLFVLIISGDFFLKAIVYLHAGDSTDFNLLQLIFVSFIVFSIFRLYMARVGSHTAPRDRNGLLSWLLLHLLLNFAILVSATGMIQYVTPYVGTIDVTVNLLVAGGTIALSLLCFAALDLIGGGERVRARVLNLVGIALLICVAAVIVAFATPTDWRIGMGTIALILVAYTTGTTIQDTRLAAALAAASKRTSRRS